jgi:glucokinase
MRDAMVPVLEVGGTHVTAAMVDTDDWTVEETDRIHLDSNADAEHILGTFVDACSMLPTIEGASWGVAMPDPFDYRNGIATFRDVGKFDAIYGIDVGTVLAERLPRRPARIVFLNDADAFILGEWTRGAAAGHSRCVGITLGTGLGSGWLVDGRITDSEPGVPALGRARHLIVHGAGLEETMSRRAIRRAYATATGDHEADVRDIAERARIGEAAATDVLGHALRALGAAMGPAMREFGADVIVIGGSMAGSWDLFEPWFDDGLGWPDAPPVLLAHHQEHAALLGAARFARDAQD